MDSLIPQRAFFYANSPSLPLYCTKPPAFPTSFSLYLEAGAILYQPEKGVIIFNNYSSGGGKDRTPHSYHLRALRLWQNQSRAESGVYPAKERGEGHGSGSRHCQPLLSHGRLSRSARKEGHPSYLPAQCGHNHRCSADQRGDFFHLRSAGGPCGD